MNGICRRDRFSQKGVTVIFALFSPTIGSSGTGCSSLAASVTSAIAYGEGMQHVRITARAEYGMVRLEGTAPTLTIADRAVAIAVEVAGCNVRSDITLKHH
ncbi:BON domain-containing protein [Rhizobium sp. LjRoot98]|uniref:BON domain-containing protein n=1 Tax=Rhizobium sp. LjRoot98 TaxID=3342345 RepID=UPI003F5097AC